MSTRKSVQDALDFCRKELEHPSQSWAMRCMQFSRMAWNQPPWAISAKLAWARVPARHRHHTHFSKVPAGVICFGLLNTHYGHAWISGRGDAGFSNDYQTRGRICRAPVNLPKWTGSQMVWWTDWSPFGMLPIWKDPRNAKLRPIGCVNH